MFSKRPQFQRIKNLPILIGLGFSAVVIVLALLLDHATPASATPADLSIAEGQYSNMVGSRIDTCTFCHTSPPSLNPFGSAYLAAGRNAAALVSIQNQDTDGDGFTNIQEINALTFPGDPNDHPVAASATPTLAPTRTNTPTAAATSTSAATATVTDTATPGPSSTPIATGVASPTSTLAASSTPLPGVTGTPTPLASITPLPPASCKDSEDNEEKDDCKPARNPHPTQVCSSKGDDDDNEGEEVSANSASSSHCEDQDDRGGESDKDNHDNGSNRGGKGGGDSVMLSPVLFSWWNSSAMFLLER